MSRQIYKILQDTCYICMKELKNVLKDQGVLMFLILVPLVTSLL